MSEPPKRITLSMSASDSFPKTPQKPMAAMGQISLDFYSNSIQYSLVNEQFAIRQWPMYGYISDVLPPSTWCFNPVRHGKNAKTTSNKPIGHHRVIDVLYVIICCLSFPTAS